VSRRESVQNGKEKVFFLIGKTLQLQNDLLNVYSHDFVRVGDICFRRIFG
jgi:hypothetical protein